MKRLFAIAFIAFALAGCAKLQELEQKVATVLSLGTASVTNPVTKDRLNQIESVAIIAFTGLNSYRTACIQKLVDTNCVSNVRAVQFYTVQIPPYLTQLRGFVKNNDQVNASLVYNEVVDLISKVKAQAASSNINLGVK